MEEMECIDNFSKCCPEETANGVACLSQNDLWDLKKSGPDSPVSLFKYACEGAETSISRNQNRFAIRDGLNGECHMDVLIK